MGSKPLSASDMQLHPGKVGKEKRSPVRKFHPVLRALGLDPRVAAYELALVRDVRPGETAVADASGGGALAEYLAAAGASDRRVFEDGTITAPAGKGRGSG